MQQRLLSAALIAAALAAGPAGAAEAKSEGAGRSDALLEAPLSDDSWLSAPLAPGTAADPSPPSVPAAASSPALSPDDVAAVARIEDYLNNLSTLKARFVQVTSEGARAGGELYLDRPGRFRFEYDPPHPVLMIADGITLLYYDKELKQASFVPLWETPLWFLVKKNVRLDGNVEVLGVTQHDDSISITVKDADNDFAGAVTITFSEQPFALREWQVTDAQGITIQVALRDPQFGVEVDKAVFDYGDLDVHGFKGSQSGR